MGTASFAAALSRSANTMQAVEEVASEALAKLGRQPTLAAVFFSSEHLPAADQIAQELCQRLGITQVFGCSGESIVGGAEEVEAAPAISLWIADLPRSQVQLMHLEFERTPEGGVIQGWPDDLAAPWPKDTFALLVGDPFSFPADLLIERMNEDRPGVPVVGGMASSGSIPGENRLILGTQTYAEGAVVVVVQGGVRLRTVVSQGCRPIGNPYVVTKAERNVIYDLGGKPALLRLKELFDQLPTREQLLVQRSLHVGRVVSEYQSHFEQGDFLVRNVVGTVPNMGGLAIGDYIRAGQTVRFHVRDQEAADAELRQLLAAIPNTPDFKPLAGLLFTCNGRGTRLFSQPNHDAQLVQKQLGNIPVAGFFAAGEIGPIGGQNFMHGFTASIALLEEVPA